MTVRTSKLFKAMGVQICFFVSYGNFTFGLHFFQNYLFRNLDQNAYFTTEISQFNGKLVGCKFWRLCTVFSLLFFVEWCVLHLCITVLASHNAQWYRIVTLLKFFWNLFAWNFSNFSTAVSWGFDFRRSFIAAKMHRRDVKRCATNYKSHA